MTHSHPSHDATLAMATPRLPLRNPDVTNVVRARITGRALAVAITYCNRAAFMRVHPPRVHTQVMYSHLHDTSLNVPSHRCNRIILPALCTASVVCPLRRFQRTGDVIEADDVIERRRRNGFIGRSSQTWTAVNSVALCTGGP